MAADTETVNAALLALMEADDATLDTVQQIINVRRKFLREMQAFENETQVSLGDYVIVFGVKPSYLNGCQMRVSEFVDAHTIKCTVTDTSGSPRPEMASQRAWGKTFTVKLRNVKYV